LLEQLFQLIDCFLLHINLRLGRFPDFPTVLYEILQNEWELMPQGFLPRDTHMPALPHHGIGTDLPRVWDKAHTAMRLQIFQKVCATIRAKLSRKSARNPTTLHELKLGCLGQLVCVGLISSSLLLVDSPAQSCAWAQGLCGLRQSCNCRRFLRRCLGGRRFGLRHIKLGKACVWGTTGGSKLLLLLCIYRCPLLRQRLKPFFD